MKNFGIQNGVSKLKRALVKPVLTAFVNDTKIDQEWAGLRFTARPILSQAIEEQEHFLNILKQNDVEILELPQDPNFPTTLDSLYTYDPMLMTSNGAILLGMGKLQRGTEPQAMKEFLKFNAIPIIGEISQPGTLEGGDMFWLDKQTLVVGLSYRSNREGFNQIKSICEKEFSNNVNIIEVQLPHWRGSDELLHLLSVISPISNDLVLVKKELLPVCFIQLLQSKGINLLDIESDQEFSNMACNVLALKPKKCVMLEGNNQTKKLLEQNGCIVATFAGNDLCHKGCGGPTCMTQPILRI